MGSKTAREIAPKQVDRDFEKALLGTTPGKRLPRCIQCGVCTGSCPAAFAMEYSPRQIIELIRLGLKAEVLTSSTIWVCASCYACTIRCPQGIDLKELMEVLKRIAIADPSCAMDQKRFYESFLYAIKKQGRVNELSLAVKNMKKTELIRSLGFGLALQRKGKIRLAPNRMKNPDDVSTLFRKALSEDEQS